MASTAAMAPLTNPASSCPALLLEDAVAASKNAASSSSSSAAAATATAADAAGGGVAVQRVQVHPLVLLHVLDHHSRRQEDAGRVIGTLLGHRTVAHGTAAVVEITNAFSVPHAERGDEVAIGKDFNRTMLQLHTRSSRKEVVVGWYATAAAAAAASGGTTTTTGEQQPPASSSSPSSLILDTSSLIHEFYAGETEDGADPIHLVVDTRLLRDGVNATAYKSSAVVLQGEPVGNLFHELHLSLNSNEPETICLHEMIAQQQQQQRNAGATNGGENGNNTTTTSASTTNHHDDHVSMTDSAQSLRVSMERLHGMLEAVAAYVDDVVAGAVPADACAGRRIADTLATVPRMRERQFDALFHDSLQDLLMVTYLSNVTRTQLTIAEKLNATLGA